MFAEQGVPHRNQNQGVIYLSPFRLRLCLCVCLCFCLCLAPCPHQLVGTGGPTKMKVLTGALILPSNSEKAISYIRHLENQEIMYIC